MNFLILFIIRIISSRITIQYSLDTDEKLIKEIKKHYRTEILYGIEDTLAFTDGFSVYDIKNAKSIDDIHIEYIFFLKNNVYKNTMNIVIDLLKYIVIILMINELRKNVKCIYEGFIFIQSIFFCLLMSGIVSKVEEGFYLPYEICKNQTRQYQKEYHIYFLAILLFRRYVNYLFDKKHDLKHFSMTLLSLVLYVLALSLHIAYKNPEYNIYNILM